MGASWSESFIAGGRGVNMKGRVEGERDQGNAHLVQDRGQIGPTLKESKGEKERMSCLAWLRLDSSGAFYCCTECGVL